MFAGAVICVGPVLWLVLAKLAIQEARRLAHREANDERRYCTDCGFA